MRLRDAGRRVCKDAAGAPAVRGRLMWLGFFLVLPALVLLALAAIIALGVAGTGNRYGNPAVTGTVLLGVSLFLANVVVPVGYQTIVELQEEA